MTWGYILIGWALIVAVIVRFFQVCAQGDTPPDFTRDSADTVSHNSEVVEP